MTGAGDAVDIAHGGYIAVDPDDLRAVAGRVRGHSVQATLAREDLLAIPTAIDGLGVGGVPALWAAVGRLAQIESALDGLASGIGTMADVFELADVRAQQALLGPGDADAAHGRELRQRADLLLSRNVLLNETERRLREDWFRHAVDGFAPPGAGDPDPAVLLPPLVLPPPGTLPDLGTVVRQAPLLAQAILQVVAAGAGVLPPGMRVRPTPGRAVVVGADGTALAPRSASPASPPVPDPHEPAVRPGDVRVTRSEPVRSTAAVPPQTLSDAVARVPYGSQPQVRVETYEFEDGSRRVVAYVDGTRPGKGPEEPWDMASNVELYLNREESDSLKAVVAALRDAGADDGTPVDLVGYSQGGMLVDEVAQTGEFAVQGVFTIGAPVEAALPRDVLSVAVRHTDDPVAGLAGGGSPYGTGSPDSLVITRAAFPGHGLDPGMPAHQLDAYRDTVRSAEQSGDPRMAAIREHLARLGKAQSVTTVDYTAERVGS
ncbi:hypothetical protein RL72_02146 [Microbacterium azadirachtae]|uniref:Alpha/beta hydrolase family protein n=1 Tax=Microbacterium azadirachtae TaxID=582680 RepID=A0A0F0KRN3_9MICO|nr:hypothetical protein [Microbacterium azadirachtae]KJL22755.1 hypothetical protein RL72_02146 [Microbacterium azadirachtae]